MLDLRSRAAERGPFDPPGGRFLSWKLTGIESRPAGPGFCSPMLDLRSSARLRARFTRREGTNDPGFYVARPFSRHMARKRSGKETPSNQAGTGRGRPKAGLFRPVLAG